MRVPVRRGTVRDGSSRWSRTGAAACPGRSRWTRRRASRPAFPGSSRGTRAGSPRRSMPRRGPCRSRRVSCRWSRRSATRRRTWRRSTVPAGCGAAPPSARRGAAVCWYRRCGAWRLQGRAGRSNAGWPRRRGRATVPCRRSSTSTEDRSEPGPPRQRSRSTCSWGAGTASSCRTSAARRATAPHGSGRSWATGAGWTPPTRTPPSTMSWRWAWPIPTGWGSWGSPTAASW